MRDLAGAAVITTSRSSRNDDYKDRFKILLDRGWGMNDNTDGALVAGQRVSGPYPSSIRYYIPLNGLLTKIYCGCSLLYCGLDQEHYYIWCSWEPMLLPMQITLSLWKEGLHILTIKISNKFFFQNSISFILGCFTKFRHYKNCSKPLNDRCGAADGS